ncbi:type II secretion system protein [Caenimonas soli]|uniref:type II secretion system protein n=1 Tax=Caenimonas soli TaxID=2735555 RepID=UPI001554F7DB|nr:type II secretion system protein [Caenimonas soli]NPC58144.1 type II secretion system protein [Caenimonas soli]
MATGRCRREHGFAYVLLLIAIALLGLVASVSLSLGAAMARRDAERQLLAIGLELQQALRSYAGIPAGAILPAPGRGPRTLEDLLRDPRAPGIQRHLRQLYTDPLTGRADWGLVRDGQGYILGIHSMAEGQPIQRTAFAPTLAGFEEAGSYRNWVFGLPLPPETLRHPTNAIMQ